MQVQSDVPPAPHARASAWARERARRAVPCRAGGQLSPEHDAVHLLVGRVPARADRAEELDGALPLLALLGARRASNS